MRITYESCDPVGEMEITPERMKVGEVYHLARPLGNLPAGTWVKVALYEGVFSPYLINMNTGIFTSATSIIVTWPPPPIKMTVKECD